jgi:uncharacterized protein YcbK (DUF882 family)
MSSRRIASLAGAIFFLLLGSLAGTTRGLSSFASLAGLSGKLRAVFALPQEEPALTAAGSPEAKPGIYKLARGLRDRIQLIVLTPFSAKVGGHIGSYWLGDWPFEGRKPADPIYENPKGFIEVTPDNFGTRVSEHFTLGQFLTKDQLSVWPKYLALDRRLLDKLELTIQELARMGHPVRGLFVMSGFRTPEYNERGVGAGGRSAVSRHQYGDAADVYPDDRSRGYMDDLNRDGRVDLKDARILAAAAEAVEEKHPELVGGIGIYPATSAHGPFVHIDARGKKARWNG